MDAARIVVDGGRAIKDVAADLGVAPVTIRTWVASYRQSQAIGAPGSGHISPAELQLKLANDEIRKLKIQRNYRLARKIEDIHLGSKRVFGSPRIYGILKAIEPNVSLRKVERLMKEYDLKSKTKKKFKVTTDSKHSLKVAPNHLMQNFTAR